MVRAREERMGKAAFILLAASLAGCGATLHPIDTGAQVPGQVRVTVKSVHGNIIEMAVLNESRQFLWVNRDFVTLLTPTGPRGRMGGGLKGQYHLEPGRLHGLNVRFDLAD